MCKSFLGAIFSQCGELANIRISLRKRIVSIRRVRSYKIGVSLLICAAISFAGLLTSIIVCHIARQPNCLYVLSQFEQESMSLLVSPACTSWGLLVALAIAFQSKFSLCLDHKSHRWSTEINIIWWPICLEEGSRRFGSINNLNQAEFLDTTDLRDNIAGKLPLEMGYPDWMAKTGDWVELQLVPLY